MRKEVFFSEYQNREKYIFVEKLKEKFEEM